jgi:hypothetical protein
LCVLAPWIDKKRGRITRADFVEGWGLPMLSSSIRAEEVRTERAKFRAFVESLRERESAKQQAKEVAK